MGALFAMSRFSPSRTCPSALPRSEPDSWIHLVVAQVCRGGGEGPCPARGRVSHRNTYTSGPIDSLPADPFWPSHLV